MSLSEGTEKFPPPLVQWSVLGILLLALYGQILVTWGIDLWDDPNYSHGLLLPLVSLYFLKGRLDELRNVKRGSSLSGFLMVVVALLLLVIGTVGAEFFTKRVSLLLLLWGLVLFLEGKQIERIFRFPLGILFFAVPLPYVLYNSAAFPLKLIASKIAAFLFSVFGMPVYLEGNVINLSHTTLEVVDACSGIRSLMTLVTLAFLLACFHHKAIWRRTLVLFAATPIAVFANAARVTMTGILTKYDPAWGEGSLHDFSGWVVFVISFVGLALFSLVIRDRKDKEE